MDDKIMYLRTYHKDIQLIKENIEGINDISQVWKEILGTKNVVEKINKMLAIWKHYIGRELSNTIMYLEENLIDIELIKYLDSYSILYSIKSANGKVAYYEGKNPMSSIIPNELQNYWDKLPQRVRDFYENVHDGFFYYASESMGLMPLQDIVAFGEEDWGILDELAEPLKLCLQSTFGVFASGMGGYVAIDVLNCADGNATLWFTNKQPRYNVDFWDVVDEWIVIGFQY